MKLLATILLFSTVTAPARADPTSDDPDFLLHHLGVSIERENTAGLEPPRCQAYLARLRELRVPITRTVEIGVKNRFLPRGRHALPAVGKACSALAYAAKVELVTLSIREALTRRAVYGCSALWPKAVAAGVKPDEPVADGVIARGISGTLESLKIKYCDEPLAASEAKHAAKLAPYRKVLANDKLAIFLDDRRAYGIVLRDGDTTETPARLAKATTWFTWWPGNVCRDGRTNYLVRRYDFDAKQRLKKEALAEHCGQPIYK